MTYNTAPLVLRGGVRPVWLPPTPSDPTERFWYRVTTERGPESGARGCRDRRRSRRATWRRAAMPSARRRRTRRRRRGAASARREVARRQAHRVRPQLEPVGARRRQRQGNAADEGRREGLRLRHRQRRLDARAIAPILLWSPDSKKIATFQQDQRGVGEMYLVDTKVGHPNAAGLEVSAARRRRRHDDPARRHRRGRRQDRPPADAAGSASLDAVRRRGVPRRVGRTCSGARTARSSRSSPPRATTSTSSCGRPTRSSGAVRDVLEEKGETFLESGNGRVNWKFLPASNEVIWFSERDNWGQLYLHDLQTGREKQQITTGDGNVTAAAARGREEPHAVFPAVGREKGRDPYFRHFYRIGMDGKNLQLLTPDDADHDVTLSPSGKFFVDSYSKPDVAAGHRAARHRRPSDRRPSRRPTSRGWSRRDGSRRSRSP